MVVLGFLQFFAMFLLAELFLQLLLTKVISPDSGMHRALAYIHG